MKYFNILIALSFGLPTYAQSTVFAPKGTVWHYSKYNKWCEPAVGAFNWTADEDTIINGWNARTIHFNDLKLGVPTQIDSLTKYVSVQGDKVYWLVGGQFVTLFDFGAIPGDTIESAVEEPTINTGCWQGNGIFKYRIDSIGMTIIDGTTLRVQHASRVEIPGFLDAEWGMAFSAKATIVERIGAISAGNWFGHGLICIPEGCPPFVRCYSDSDLHYQSPKWLGLNKPCDFTTKTNEAVSKIQDINIFYDVVTNEISVKSIGCIALGYRLMEGSGRVLQEVPFGRESAVQDFTVPIGDQPAGVYILAVRTEQGWLARKVKKV